MTTQRITFEAYVEKDGQYEILSLIPGDNHAATALFHALRTQLHYAEGWESEYRSYYVLAGLGGKAETIEHIQAIAVPHWRKIRGEVRDGLLQINELLVSEDKEHWQSPPTPIQSEDDHPAFALSGEVLGRFGAVQWEAARIDIEPEPEGELLEIIEEMVNRVNASYNRTTWDEQHHTLGGEGNHPEAKRIGLEIRQMPPLLSRTSQPLARIGKLEFWLLLPLEYSMDSKIWKRYPIGEEALQAAEEAGLAQENDLDANDPMKMLSKMLEMQAATITVWQDGRIDLPDEIQNAHYRDALVQSILKQTGAGNSDWVGGIQPAPHAVRVQVMTALLEAAPQLLEQSYVVSHLSSDGQEWTSLHDEADIAQQLQALQQENR